MIIGFLLQIFFAVLAFFVGLLPVVAMPSGWTSSLALIWYYVNSFSFLFPVTTLLTVLVFALSFHVIVLFFRFVLWIIHLIRGR